MTPPAISQIFIPETHIVVPCDKILFAIRVEVNVQVVHLGAGHGAQGLARRKTARAEVALPVHFGVIAGNGIGQAVGVHVAEGRQGVGQNRRLRCELSVAEVFAPGAVKHQIGQAVGVQVFKRSGQEANGIFHVGGHEFVVVGEIARAVVFVPDQADLVRAQQVEVAVAVKVGRPDAELVGIGALGEELGGVTELGVGFFEDEKAEQDWEKVLLHGVDMFFVGFKI